MEETTSPNEENNKTLGSPNKVTWTLCRILGRLAARATPDERRDLVEQDGLLAVFLGINAIEAFVNIFFRVVAEETEFAHAKEQILKELESRGFPLHKKIQKWPQLAFGKSIDEDDPRWANFISLRDRRNAFMHFKTTHDSIDLPGNVTVSGLADLSIFAELDEETPWKTLMCVRQIVEALGECRGVKTKDMPAFIHHWLGIID